MWRGLFKDRKRTRRWLTGGAAVCALLIGVLIGPGREIIGQVLRGESLADLLAGRSPGPRGTADLVKIKAKSLGLASVEPKQRVLPLLRTRDPVAPIEEAALPGGASPLATADDPFGAPGGGFSDDFTDTVFPGSPISDGPIGFPIVPPGNPGLFPSDPPPPEPTPAIPEPASWAMMLFGLGLIGGVLRRDRTKRTSAATAR